MKRQNWPKLTVIYGGLRANEIDGLCSIMTTVGSYPDGKWPRGTVMYREIKLLTRVWG